MTAPAAVRPASETRVLSSIGIGHFLSHFYILCIPPMLPLLAQEFEVGFAKPARPRWFPPWPVPCW